MVKALFSGIECLVTSLHIPDSDAPTGSNAAKGRLADMRTKRHIRNLINVVLRLLE
ncbi:MAG: hypothetical protein HQL08_12970 [Nitrospirae bacterium]|nr:hypothetical protein [Nitrospirota bacterium]